MLVKRPLHVENIWFYTCYSILYESEVGADNEGAIVCYALDWCMLFCMWLGSTSRMSRGKWLKSSFNKILWYHVSSVTATY